MWFSVHGAKTYCIYFKSNKSLELIPISGFIVFLQGFIKIPLRAPTLGLLETCDASLQLQSCVALRTVGSTAFLFLLLFMSNYFQSTTMIFGSIFIQFNNVLYCDYSICLETGTNFMRTKI